MCGIYGIIYSNNILQLRKILENIAVNNSLLLKHRGNDWRGITKTESAVLCHERLSIIDPTGGSQPLNYDYVSTLLNIYNEFGEKYITVNHKLSLTVNGEIYNYKKLKNKWCYYLYQSESDCEVINSGYYFYKQKNYITTGLKELSNEIIIEFLNQLDGQFSFILHDTDMKSTLVARDPIGITSLYYGLDGDYNLYISSEMKALSNCIFIEVFPAGHYLYITQDNLQILKKEDEYFTNNYQKYTNIKKFIKPYYLMTNSGTWLYNYNNNNIIPKTLTDMNYSLEDLYKNIRDTFTNAVIKRMMADVNFGSLLSGGLDSSLVTSIAVRHFNENKNLFPNIDKIHTFSIGLKGYKSPDLKYAQIVADKLGTHHHTFTYTIQEGLEAIKDVIYYLETYDITTIRASTPMFLLSKKIREYTNIKMVLSGEGSDEILGGYLYFLNAPNNITHQRECMRRVGELSYFDCLRANKSTMAYSLEARVPFLDKEFISLCIDIDNSIKTQNGIEKYMLRKAFDTEDIYLPKEILWRQKEQFSDGVGYSWIDTLKDITNSEHIKYINPEYVNFDWDLLLKEANGSSSNNIYSTNIPTTKEGLVYRMIYDSLFPKREHLVKMWIPKTEWSGVSVDPSGRSQSTHKHKN